MSKKPISKVNNYNMATKKLFLLFVNAAINSYSWHLSQKKRVTTNILNLRWVFIGFVGRHSLGSSRKSPMRICWNKQHIPSPLFIKISWRLWKLHYWVNRHQVIVMTVIHFIKLPSSNNYNLQLLLWLLWARLSK